MGKRTLSSCWKQYEKLSQNYLAAEADDPAIFEKLSILTEKANADNIGAALHTLFVLPFTSKCTAVEFTVDCVNGIPPHQTIVDEDEDIIRLHPISAVKFIKTARNIDIAQKNDSDFIRSRHASFLAEIGKMNSIHILFLLVLQRVAYMLQIAHLEKRGGIIEVAEDESYHTLLWAFKELEIFLRKTYGLTIRAHYGISWYESDWITGR